MKEGLEIMLMSLNAVSNLVDSSRDYAYPNADSSLADSSGDCADSAESGFQNEEKSEELGLNSVSVGVNNV